jgi:ATP adenylyltransferase
MSYILASRTDAETETGCFLCRDRDEHRDAENLVLVRGERSIVVLNRFPYNNGHLLVAPLAHKADLEELDEAEMLDCMKQLRDMSALYRRLLKPDGFNIGINLGRPAGAGLPGHLHWHLVPRWSGDTNFMSVVDDVRVISQSLKSLYGHLRSALGPFRT